MKTYQDYYDEWLNSTESRDLAFDEWLMLLLDRKEGEMTEEMRKLNEEWEEKLAEAKRQRDAYYDELQRYRQAEAEQRAEIQRFKKFLEESAMTDEEYLNSKIEAYGKAHPDGNKEDLELLAEMRGYDKKDE